MREKLVKIAFYLAPQVDELMKQQVNDEEVKYQLEHEECDLFHLEKVEIEKEKFDVLYQTWKASVVRFHKLKMSNAVETFVKRLNSKEFVNNNTRV